MRAAEYELVDDAVDAYAARHEGESGGGRVGVDEVVCVEGAEGGLADASAGCVERS